MTPTQSKRLKIGQRVAWHDSADDQGTVSASDWSDMRIEWDNGKNQFFHHNNMGEVEGPIWGNFAYTRQSSD